MDLKQFFDDIGLGFTSFFKAFAFIFSNGLWHYYLYPLVLSIVFFFTLFAAKGMLTDYLQDLLFNAIGFEETEEGVQGFLRTLTSGIIYWMVWGVSLVIFYRINKYLVLIVLSPVLSILSERTEEILTGTKFKTSPEQVMRDAVRGTIVALRNLALELSVIFLCFILSWIIPFFGFLSPFIIFFVGAYFYGFSLMDYTCERNKMTISEGVKFIRNNKGIAVSNGGLFSLAFFFPFLGTIIAPITGVVGATLAVHEKHDLNKLHLG